MVKKKYISKYFSDYPVIRSLLGQTTSQDHGQRLKTHTQTCVINVPLLFFYILRLVSLFLISTDEMKAHTVSPVLDTPYAISGQPPCLCSPFLVSSTNRCISPTSSSSVMSSLRKRCWRAGLHWFKVREPTKLETLTTRPKIHTHTKMFEAASHVKLICQLKFELVVCVVCLSSFQEGFYHSYINTSTAHHI